jgi:hypothetical protein
MCEYMEGKSAVQVGVCDLVMLYKTGSSDNEPHDIMPHISYNLLRVGQNRTYTVYDHIFGDFPARNM